MEIYIFIKASGSITSQILSYSNTTVLALGYFPGVWLVTCYLSLTLAPLFIRVPMATPLVLAEALSLSLGSKLPFFLLPSCRLLRSLF